MTELHRCGTAVVIAKTSFTLELSIVRSVPHSPDGVLDREGVPRRHYRKARARCLQTVFTRDCMGEPGSRCLAPRDGGTQPLPECVPMACSESGLVLVYGSPCDDGAAVASPTFVIVCQ